LDGQQDGDKMVFLLRGLQAKVKLLAEMWLRGGRDTVVYTGAGGEDFLEGMKHWKTVHINGKVLYE